MKKLVLLSTFVCVLTFSMPVYAVSPTTAAVAQNTQAAAARTQSPRVNSEASALLAGGAVETQAAAVAVADTLVSIESAPVISEQRLTSECSAILAGMTDAQKATIADAAAKRNMSSEEVIGNFVKSDSKIKNSQPVAYNANLCRNAVNGKSSNVNVIVSKPDDKFTNDAINAVNGMAGASLVNTFSLGLEGNAMFNSLDTALQVGGVKATDTVDNFKAYQMINGKLVEVKITAVKKGAIGFHLTSNAPVMLVRVK